MSNGSYTKMFCVKDRGREGPLYAAKHMMDNVVDGNTEVDILRSLQSSENVVKIIETFHHELQTILITEYLAGQSPSDHRCVYDKNLGGSLFERLSSSQYHLTEDKCKLFMKQIMSGISFIHRANVLHLNLTPSNIIFHNKVVFLLRNLNLSKLRNMTRHD